MHRTTVYLPDDLRASIKRLAARQGRSEADVIRRALSIGVAAAEPPDPKLPLIPEGLGDESAAERVDELLEGFGER